MKKEQLAEELRKRQYDLGVNPKELIDSLTDDEIIDCYIKCADCGKRIVNKRQLAMSLAQATSADHFFVICDRFSAH